jgi:competence protein ComEC
MGTDMGTPFPPESGTAVLISDETQLGTPQLKLHIVDVGQGDGAVAELPGGGVMAIDGGPDRGASYQAFINGIGRMDYLLLSHAHFDHYTGLRDAVDLLPMDCQGRLFDPGYDRQGVLGYANLVRDVGCRYRAVGSGMSLALDPQVDVKVVGASATPYPESDNTGENNTSLITYVRFGRFTALFTGDAQTEAEQRVYNEQQAVHANVMKLGHHGSCNATATSYLRAVAPDVAVISVSASNFFGHPHCQTIGKLQAQGTHWYRTDSNGTITIKTDGERYTVTPSRGPQDDPDCPRDCGASTLTDF